MSTTVSFPQRRRPAHDVRAWRSTRMICAGGVAADVSLFRDGEGCASNVAGARPSDMSQTEHESVAAEEQTKAASHSRQYDPTALTAVDDCTQSLDHAGDRIRPTSTRSKQKHTGERQPRTPPLPAPWARRRLAHRRSFARGSRHEPFFHHAGIVETRPLTAASGASRTGEATGESAGATVILLPAAGLTAERLERVVQCHIARNATLGSLADMPYCPLASKGVFASVGSTGTGFDVKHRLGRPRHGGRGT